jgi:hypothetical protein
VIRSNSASCSPSATMVRLWSGPASGGLADSRTAQARRTALPGSASGEVIIKVIPFCTLKYYTLGLLCT